MRKTRVPTAKTVAIQSHDRATLQVSRVVPLRVAMYMITTTAAPNVPMLSASARRLLYPKCPNPGHTAESAAAANG